MLLAATGAAHSQPSLCRHFLTICNKYGRPTFYLVISKLLSLQIARGCNPL
jgi:hypothetical protein